MVRRDERLVIDGYFGGRAVVFIRLAEHDVLVVPDKSAAGHGDARQRRGVGSIAAVVARFDQESAAAVRAVAFKRAVREGDVRIVAVLEVDIYAAHPCLEALVDLVGIGAVVRERAAVEGGIGEIFRVNTLDQAILHGEGIRLHGRRFAGAALCGEIDAVIEAVDRDVGQRQLHCIVGGQVARAAGDAGIGARFRSCRADALQRTSASRPPTNGWSSKR